MTLEAGYKAQQSRKRQQILAADLPGIPSYHTVEVPVICHKAKVSEHCHLSEIEVYEEKVVNTRKMRN